MPLADGRSVLVGIEVHQQLRTRTKLFCACPPVKSEMLPYSFERRLRPAQSETGRLDPAAVFEFAKGKSNQYLWNPESACLVEADEEPPHDLSAEALETSAIVASMLGSRIIDEVHVMRKIVIDGSNTTGFQRTAVVGLGGGFSVDGTRVGVQSVTVEEDAARVMGEDESSRRFALDRLGTPLVEVTLDPVAGTPEFIGRVALHLGRTLRSTGRMARGLGTIRQDLNVSVDGGAVVEVKGVQKLNLVAKVVGYEAERQAALIEVARKVRESAGRVKCRTLDITTAARSSGSKTLRDRTEKGGKALCVVADGLNHLLGWEPAPGVRLGREAAEVARANGLGGLIHSDEFRKQGVSESEEGALRTECSAPEGSALVILAGREDVVRRAAGAVAARLEAAGMGVPAETRAATEEGETQYMRPRPGAQRMYPETDVPQLDMKKTAAMAAKSLPRPWEDTVMHYEKDGRLSRDLALRVYDSDSSDAFERLMEDSSLEPSVIASLLVELPPRLAREGVPESGMTEAVLSDLVRALESGKVAKEAAPEVLRLVARGDALSVENAVKSLRIVPLSEKELTSAIDGIVQKSGRLISEKGEGAFSQIMGEAMAVARGKVDGALVAKLVREKIQSALKKSG